MLRNTLCLLIAAISIVISSSHHDEIVSLEQSRSMEPANRLVHCKRLVWQSEKPMKSYDRVDNDSAPLFISTDVCPLLNLIQLLLARAIWFSFSLVANFITTSKCACVLSARISWRLHSELCLRNHAR